MIGSRLGLYRIATTIGLLATQAADGTLWSLRWTAVGKVLRPLGFRISCIQTTAATATIFPRFQLFKARSFTVSDSGGVALTTSGNSGKKKTDMQTSLIAAGDLRISNAVAGLTVGTRTLDPHPTIEIGTQQATGSPNALSYVTDDFRFGTDELEYPSSIAQNEGLVLRGPTTVFGAAGTADLIVEFDWAEEMAP